MKREWQSEHEKNLQFTLEMLDTTHYFRNNSTGKPTLRHIMNEEKQKSYCGWHGDVCAEVVVVDQSDYLSESCVCKKCLSLYRAYMKEQYEIVKATGR